MSRPEEMPVIAARHPLQRVYVSSRYRTDDVDGRAIESEAKSSSRLARIHIQAVPDRVRANQARFLS